MRSNAVQQAKCNPSKRSYFTLTAAESSSRLTGRAKESDLEQLSHSPSKKYILTHYQPKNITLPHTTTPAAAQFPKKFFEKSEAKVGSSSCHRPNGKRTNRNFKSSKEKTTDPPEILL